MTKLQEELNKKKKDYNEIEARIRKTFYGNLAEYFAENNNIRFRKILAKFKLDEILSDYFSESKKNVKILKDPRFKESVQTFLSDGRKSLSYNIELFVELINHHKINVNPAHYVHIANNYDGEIYLEDVDALRKYVAKNPYRASYHSVGTLNSASLYLLIASLKSMNLR